MPSDGGTALGQGARDRAAILPTEGPRGRVPVAGRTTLTRGGAVIGAMSSAAEAGARPRRGERATPIGPALPWASKQWLSADHKICKMFTQENLA